MVPVTGGGMAVPLEPWAAQKVERQQATTSREGLIQLPVSGEPTTAISRGFWIPHQLPSCFLVQPVSMSLFLDCKGLKDSSHFLPLTPYSD